MRSLRRDAKDRKSGAGVTRGTVQSIPNAAITVITFDTVEFDYEGLFNRNYPERLTARKAALHHITAMLDYTPTASGVRGFFLWKNGNAFTNLGTELIRLGQDAAQVGTTQTGMNASIYLELLVGDYVTLCGYQNSGGAINTVNVGPRLQMVRCE